MAGSCWLYYTLSLCRRRGRGRLYRRGGKGCDGLMLASLYAEDGGFFLALL